MFNSLDDYEAHAAMAAYGHPQRLPTVNPRGIKALMMRAQSLKRQLPFAAQALGSLLVGSKRVRRTLPAINANHPAIKKMPYRSNRRSRYSRAASRRHRSRRKSFNSRPNQVQVLADLMMPKKTGYHECQTSVKAFVNACKFEDFAEDDVAASPLTLVKTVHRSTAQNTEFFEFVKGSSAVTFSGSAEYTYVDQLQTTYTILNPGNAPVIVDYWILSPKYCMTDGPKEWMTNLIDNAIYNPNDVSGVSVEATMVDFNLWPEKMPDFHHVWKVHKKGKFALGADQSNALTIKSKNFRVAGLEQSVGAQNSRQTKYLLVKLRGTLGSSQVTAGLPETALIGHMIGQIDVIISNKVTMRIIPSTRPHTGTMVLGGTAPALVAGTLYTAVNAEVTHAYN